MPKKFIKKSFQLYFSNLKNHSIPHLHSSSKTFFSTRWILRRCKHPKAPSLSFTNVNKSTDTTSTITQDDVDSATLSDIDRYLSENFKSLYLHENNNENDVEGKIKNKDFEENDANDDKNKPDYFISESPRFLNLPPNLRGPHNRFFVDSSSEYEEPRASKVSSIVPSSASIEESKENDQESETNKNAKNANPGPGDFITLLTFSMNPCDEFRRSMIEMIEERNGEREVDSEFLEEVLFLHLNWNDQKLHKFILSAYVDLMVVLREKLGASVPV